MDRILPLSREEIILVEENIHIIKKAIFSRIIIDNSKFGMEYDDLFQEGCLLLCKAAMNYDKSRNHSFENFAFVVIVNGLFTYCRKMKKQRANTNIVYEKIISALYTESNYDEAFLYEKSLIESDILIFLENIKKQYSGTVRLGIEAIILKTKGLTGADIACMYGVKPNLVGAWISRAVNKLRKNSIFNLFMNELNEKNAS